MTSGDVEGTTPRRTRIRLNASAYRTGEPTFLLTICTDARNPWFSAHPMLADAATGEIAKLPGSRGTRLYAWCVMPDHVHLIMRDRDVIECVRILKGRLTVAARRLDPSRRLWQRGFHDHALRQEEHVLVASRYVLTNPVRAGMVGTAAEYAWSGSAIWPGWRAWLG
jgi:REP element-mobilizing transposase RayT